MFYKDNDEITAYMRAFRKDEETAQMGRVVTRRHGIGLGGKLLKEGVAFIKKIMRPKRIYIEAQVYAKGYYAREGFKACSDEFSEDGIPHVQMILEC